MLHAEKDALAYKKKYKVTGYSIRRICIYLGRSGFWKCVEKGWTHGESARGESYLSTFTMPYHDILLPLYKT